MVVGPTETMQIGEMALRHGVSTATLRFYERVGLLPAPGRSRSGYRLYGREHDQRLRFIGRAKDLDLSLEEIGVLLEAWDTGGCGSARAQLRHAVAHKAVEVRRRAREALVFADQLAQVYARLLDPVGAVSDGECGCVPELPAGHADGFDAELGRIAAFGCSCPGDLQGAEAPRADSDGGSCPCCVGRTG